MPQPPILSPDRRELLRKLAADGRRILQLEAKLAKLPVGAARDGVLQELRPLLIRRDAFQLRLKRS